MNNKLKCFVTESEFKLTLREINSKFHPAQMEKSVDFIMIPFIGVPHGTILGALTFSTVN